MIFPYKIKNLLKEKLRNYIHNEIFPYEYNLINLNYDYLNNKNNNTKVVYTCLTGNYDKLKLQEYLDYSYDYVCFTDNINLLKLKNFGAWTIKPLFYCELDNHYNNRWHKTHPHILFPEYESSIYIDSNIIFLNDSIYKQLEDKHTSICIPKHYRNDCIYDEIKYAVSLNKITKDECKLLIDYLEKQSFPKHYGLNENNVIYRKHNDPKIVKLMEEWWTFIKEYCKRDQLSLSYVLWKNGISPSDISINNVRYSNNARIECHNL